MNLIITIVSFILVFSVLILIHELGHFWMAKRAGIKVEEFGFGLPPRLWGKKKGDTIYSINWIPFGGFVRMYGEDATDPKMMKSKKSFVGKTMRQRTLVIIAGVVMNLLLAWFLIWVGMMFGMDKFILTQDDFKSAIVNEDIVLEEGVVVQAVSEDSLAQELGFRKGDKILKVNEEYFDIPNYNELLNDFSGQFLIERDDKLVNIKILNEDIKEGEDFSVEEDLGLYLEDFTTFSRIQFLGAREGEKSFLSELGLNEGDLILGLNGEKIYSIEQLKEKILGENVESVEVFKDSSLEIIEIENDFNNIIISGVAKGSPAFDSGLKSGDLVVSVNGLDVNDPLQLPSLIKQKSKVNLKVQRDDQVLDFELELDENGMIGIYFSEVFSVNFAGDLFKEVQLLSSIKETKKDQYLPHIALYKSFTETVRLSGLTFDLFIDSMGKLFSTGQFPEEIGGPVAIAEITGVVVQDGILALMRFVALISISLAVLNIMPFPALDGGRLLFIIIELISGKRVNQKVEAIIHAIGFMLLLVMILFVTYRDIINLF